MQRDLVAEKVEIQPVRIFAADAEPEHITVERSSTVEFGDRDSEMKRVHSVSYQNESRGQPG